MSGHKYSATISYTSFRSIDQRMTDANNTNMNWEKMGNKKTIFYFFLKTSSAICNS